MYLIKKFNFQIYGNIINPKHNSIKKNVVQVETK